MNQISQITNVIKKNFSSATIPVETPDSPTSENHLCWMLSVVESSTDMTDTKSIRWVGYIYGVMHSESKLPNLTLELLECLYQTKKGVKIPVEAHEPCVNVALYYLDIAKERIGITTFHLSKKSINNTYCILRHITSHDHTAISANFWLGYAQGYLVKNNRLDVQSERDRTRAIFNGS